ncbi:hypothetical protein BAUCODRAFT_117532 [Baudoinia panamericana UAMH 10762]|uniref:Ino eighty subunit 1 n=1 Tax=Baudoinia panamericana (strain UAMH 10762) TaxID=717646 RepID=M2LBI4_BAUPA|nr:uncharacterized protein BAUCODRAFT_117532 [Baudoinia panamericana UAMH 10762]EMC91217.1 hypothetical protein BAUCODRAFT_117532 [Baudoinia panamericana UAMH 10762]
MSSLQHILADEPADPSNAAAPALELKSASSSAAMPPPPSIPVHGSLDDNAADTPKDEDDVQHTSTTTSTRRNPSGSISSVFSGNKMKHLKKEDGIPLWRKDIQYEFLRLVFYDTTRCFAKYSMGPGKDKSSFTFAEIYIDAMARSSKCSKILKEKLLADTEGAISMAMVCLLVNVGRMNTTLNFFPEMRAQLRTYHSIPALQANQDPNTYKQLQDAPRLKSILKGATEDEPQPNTLDDIQTARVPRTNPVNLIFVMSQYAPKITETHFQQPRDFFDLVMRGSLSSASRAKAFLWLIWWYLESNFTREDAERNPFGPGQYGEGEEGTDAMPIKVPTLESLTEEQAALENVDTEEEKHFGEVKRKERIAILASEPSPAMTALKRARKEKGLTSARDTGHGSDEETNEHAWYRNGPSAMRPSGLHHETGSEYTRSPSPVTSHGFQAVNLAKPVGDMRINNLLNNDEASMDTPSAQPGASKKGPGRGNWRRNRTKQEPVPLAVRGTENSYHVPLAPNTGQLSFVTEVPNGQLQPATPGSPYAQYGNGLSHHSPQQTLSFQPPVTRDHIPTPSYQAQKRNRGVTQHQSALINHRRQQIDYMLDRRIRKVHARARGIREDEGAIIRAWKRIRLMPTEYDSEEEAIRARKLRDKTDDDWRVSKNKENTETPEELEALRKPRVLYAGLALPISVETNDVGEQALSLAKTFRRTFRRLERWEDTNLPGQSMLRRQHMLSRGMLPSQRYSYAPHMDHDGFEFVDSEYSRRGAIQRQRSGTGRGSERRILAASAGDAQRGGYDMEDDEGGGELDEEERELLGEVDADEDEDEDEDMADN